MNKVVNENILKLRELTDKMSQFDIADRADENYEQIVRDIKKIFDTETPSHARNKDMKLQSYERIYSKLEIILNKLKLT